MSAPKGKEIASFWTAFLAPPVVFLTMVSVNYALSGWACRTGHLWVLHAIVIAALTIDVATTFLAWRLWRGLGGGDAGEAMSGRRRLMAIGGLTNGAFFALAIVAADVAIVVLGGCG